MRSYRAPRRAAFVVAFAMSLSTLAPSLAEAAGVAPTAATAEDKKRAQAEYQKGAEHFEAGRHAEALVAFRASYDIVASPNSHLMIARTLRDSGQPVAAYEEIELVVAEAKRLAAADPKYEGTVAKAVADQNEIRQLVALLTVTVRGGTDEAKVTLGGKPFARERWGKPVPVAPGPIEIQGTAADGYAVKRKPTLAAGATEAIELDLAAPAAPVAASVPAPKPAAKPEPAPAPESAPEPAPAPAPEADAAEPKKTSLLPYALAAGGVGVAGMAMFAIAGAMNQSTFAGLEDACTNNVCTPEDQEQIDAGKTQQTVANVGLVLGLVGLGAGVTLFVIDLKSKPAPAASAGLTVGPGSVGVRGRF